MLDNIGTQQYFGINSYETADEISKRIGDATSGIASVNDTSGHSHSTGNPAQPQSGNRSTSYSVTRSEIARRLLKPEEVLTLNENICLIFHKNLPVCLGRLVKFFEAPEFKRGGTAAPRRLGLAAGIMAVVTLIVSTGVTLLALSLAPPQPAPRLPGRAAEIGGDGWQAWPAPDPPQPPRRPCRGASLAAGPATPHADAWPVRRERVSHQDRIARTDRADGATGSFRKGPSRGSGKRASGTNGTRKSVSRSCKLG